MTASATKVVQPTDEVEIVYVVRRNIFNRWPQSKFETQNQRCIGCVKIIWTPPKSYVQTPVTLETEPEDGGTIRVTLTMESHASQSTVDHLLDLLLEGLPVYEPETKSIVDDL